MRDIKSSVLIVDEDAFSVQRVRETLQRRGYQVRMAHNLETALRLVNRENFTTILVSQAYSHPTFIAWLRRTGTLAPVVVMKSDFRVSSVEEIVECYGRGAVALVAKQPEAVNEIVHTLAASRVS